MFQEDTLEMARVSRNVEDYPLKITLDPYRPPPSHHYRRCCVTVGGQDSGLKGILYLTLNLG